MYQFRNATVTAPELGLTSLHSYSNDFHNHEGMSEEDFSGLLFFHNNPNENVDWLCLFFVIQNENKFFVVLLVSEARRNMYVNKKHFLSCLISLQTIFPALSV